MTEGGRVVYLQDCGIPGVFGLGLVYLYWIRKIYLFSDLVVVGNVRRGRD